LPVCAARHRRARLHSPLMLYLQQLSASRRALEPVRQPLFWGSELQLRHSRPTRSSFRTEQADSFLPFASAKGRPAQREISLRFSPRLFFPCVGAGLPPDRSGPRLFPPPLLSLCRGGPAPGLLGAAPAVRIMVCPVAMFVCSPSVKRTLLLQSRPAIYSHFRAMPKPEAFSRVLIDQELRESGWDLLDERRVRFELDGHSGRADYVLSGERGPLCVLEAKRPDLDPYEAKEQACGYADNRQEGVGHGFTSTTRHL
jgi:hypothetical protein